jgi:hypothetical protein
MRNFLAAAILFTPAALIAGEKTVPRYIEFRDGSILRMNVVDEDWPITIIRENGAVKHTKVKLSAIESFTLTAEKGFADKLEMLSNVRKLGSEDFWDREKAMAKLLKSERNIRADLETCLRFITDLETEVRIKRIQGNFPKPAADEPPLPTHFDLFYYKEICWGHLGDEGIPVVSQNKVMRLTRADVKRVSVDLPPQLAGLIRTRGVAVGVRRLAMADFPAGCVEEGFERTPDGQPLGVGQNIQKTFVPRGFTLSTSVANSFVSVNSFTVSGKSKGFSVANHQPLWEGEITIKFVLPGREDVPAGVTHFGCYMAAVVPKGTALVAEDIHGRELGRVETQNNGHDFVGIHSPVPMHKIRVVPDTKLDRDYTLDDFIFTPPQSVEAGHAKLYTAYVDMGRAHVRDVVFSKDHVQLLGMPGRLPDLTIPRSQVWRINAPDKGAPKPNEWFVELRDGSVLTAPKQDTDGNRPLFARLPDLFEKPAQIAGLWHSAAPRYSLVAREKPPVFWNGEKKAWEAIKDLRFLDMAVEGNVDGKPRLIPYTSLSVWPATGPNRLPAGTWLIHTRTGEELVLDGKTPIIGSWSSALAANWRGRALRLGGAEIRAISLVGDDDPRPPSKKP